MPKWPGVRLLGKESKKRREKASERDTYSDLIVIALVLHVLVKFFLGVKLNATHLQLLPHLQHKPK